MAATIDMSGARTDLVVRRGDTFTNTDYLYDGNGAAVTASAATIEFKTGTLAAVGSAVASVTGSITIGAGYVTWGITTEAETEVFTVGTEYIWCYRVTLPSGLIQTVRYGVYEPVGEIA